MELPDRHGVLFRVKGGKKPIRLMVMPMENTLTTTWALSNGRSEADLDADIKALAAVEHLGLPGTDSLDSVKQWATHHQLVFSDLQIEKIRKASLLLQNRMAPADANMLAMAARSALGKKGKGPTPSAPAQEQPQTSPENDPKATKRGLPE
jgi:hypothetical protein